MKHLLSALFAASLLLTSQASAADLNQHPFFKHLIGEWEAEGELKNENNEPVTVKESWTGRVDAEDTFSIEGSRTINGDTQKFTWTYTRSAATDNFEAILTGGDGQPLRFESSLIEEPLTLTLKAITGNGSGNISVEDTFADEGKDTLTSKVTFTGDQGQTTLQGAITHKKKKAP
ncbi:MAG: hypothetical protein V4662_10030 [Verrucomicrobiota bacterium]